MKIYTKVVYQWHGDELVKVEEESHDYEGPVAHAKGGGGGGNQYYENLNRLYGIQADQAELLGGAFRDTVLPAYQEWGQEARGLGSQANLDRASTDAAAAARAATTSNIQDLTSNMASYGINPADASFQRQLRIAALQGAGQEAAAGTAARDRQRQLGLAATQDFVTAGMGTPTQATQAASAAISGNTAALNAQNQQYANQQSAIGNAVRGGINLYGAGSDKGWWADGGYVLGLQNGGYVQRLAMGGMAGGMRPFGSAMAPPPPPAPGAKPQPAAAEAAGNVALGAKAVGSSGRLVEGVGNLTGNSNIAAFGKGMNLSSTQASAAADAYRTAATQMVDASLGTVVPEAAIGAEAALGAEAAVGAEAALGAEALTGTAAALEGGAALASLAGTAIPVLGAGLAIYGIGSELDWWADGGPVPKMRPGSMGAKGGEVDGPGGPKDDLIPAMLSDGEFVLPVGTVKKYGLAKLEKMRQEGLDFEKQLGIGRA